MQNIVGKRISNYVYIEPYDPNIDDMISDTEEGLGNSQVANVRLHMKLDLPCTYRLCSSPQNPHASTHLGHAHLSKKS